MSTLLHQHPAQNPCLTPTVTGKDSSPHLLTLSLHLPTVPVTHTGLHFLACIMFLIIYTLGLSSSPPRVLPSLHFTANFYSFIRFHLYCHEQKLHVVCNVICSLRPVLTYVEFTSWQHSSCRIFAYYMSSSVDCKLCEDRAFLFCDHCTPGTDHSAWLIVGTQ